MSPIAARALCLSGYSSGLDPYVSSRAPVTLDAALSKVHSGASPAMPSTGLINAPVSNITNVELELYNVFPLDSVSPPSGRVLSRVNSPSDVEIDSATRDRRAGTLAFAARPLAQAVPVANTVVNGINPNPSRTNGEGPAIGDQVQITITFKKPIVLPAGHYFFRPEVQVTDGDFLFMSAPRPIVSPGVPVPGDLQAWIRNSRLAPDWVRIGTDVVGATPPATPPTFNMSFSLLGDTLPDAGFQENRIALERVCLRWLGSSGAFSPMRRSSGFPASRQ